MRLAIYATLPYLASYAGARLALARGARELRPGPVTLVLLGAVAVPSVVGLVVPEVQHALERNADRIGEGQVWRLVTALVQQDGGVAGTIGNLVALLVLGTVAEHLLGGPRTAATFLATAIFAQLPALAWQPIGAGNSVANFGLAGALALLVVGDRRRPRPAAAAAVITLLAGILLAALADVHGPPLLLGAAIGVCFLRPSSGG